LSAVGAGRSRIAPDVSPPIPYTGAALTRLLLSLLNTHYTHTSHTLHTHYTHTLHASIIYFFPFCIFCIHVLLQSSAQSQLPLNSPFIFLPFYFAVLPHFHPIHSNLPLTSLSLSL